MYSFDSLPKQIHKLSEDVDLIKRLLSENNHVQQPEPDRWFDINELCEYLPEKPAKSTVYTMVRERRLPFHKRGKHLAFLKSEIDENIKSGKVKSKFEIKQEAENFLVSKRRRAQQ